MMGATRATTHRYVLSIDEAAALGDITTWLLMGGWRVAIEREEYDAGLWHLVLVTDAPVRAAVRAGVDVY